MTRSNEWYGWIPDLPDQRDFVYLLDKNLSADFWTVRLVESDGQ